MFCLEENKAKRKKSSATVGIKADRLAKSVSILAIFKCVIFCLNIGMFSWRLHGSTKVQGGKVYKVVTEGMLCGLYSGQEKHVEGDTLV